ncbi:MAG TPA: hypothetical protein VFH80_17525 [Solirubrobacteraceae bacterium]|nr:hypothetical protein [Solirubrobacteraceae bacterium]
MNRVARLADLNVDAAPLASIGRSAPRPTPSRRAPGVRVDLDLERPASGVSALLTGASGGQPAPVELDRCYCGRPVAYAATRWCEAHLERVLDMTDDVGRGAL